MKNKTKQKKDRFGHFLRIAYGSYQWIPPFFELSQVSAHSVSRFPIKVTPVNNAACLESHNLSERAKIREKEKGKEIRFRTTNCKPHVCPLVSVLLIIKPRWWLKIKVFYNWLRAWAFTTTGELPIDVEHNKTYDLSFSLKCGLLFKRYFLYKIAFYYLPLLLHHMLQVC